MASTRAMPEPSAQTPELLTQRLIRLLRLLDRQADVVLREHGLRIIEWRILAELAADSPLTVRVLAERLFISRSEASRGTGVLAQLGYVRREDDPADQRSRLFFATAAGAAAYQRIMPLRQQFMTEITSRMPDGERCCFDRALDRLTREVEAVVPDVPGGRVRTKSGRTGSC